MGRAATCGGPYSDAGSSLSVGADVLIGPQKSLPLTREVAFAKQMTEGETGRPHGAAPTNPGGAVNGGAKRRSF